MCTVLVTVSIFVERHKWLCFFSYFSVMPICTAYLFACKNSYFGSYGIVSLNTVPLNLKETEDQICLKFDSGH